MTTSETPRVQKKIIHVDMDSFFASVEIRDRPELKGKPVAVGGSPEGRGVISTCSYEARKFGVRSAMSSRRALQLCPDLILVRGSFEKYRKASRQIREIFSEYTELIEPLSLDEAYLDVSECELFQGSATLIAQDIRKKIFEATALTASAGIAENKFLAKVASDWNKPNGQKTIRPDEVAGFVKKLPLKKIPGVGKVTARKMQLMGFNTCEDLQKLSQFELSQKFGKWGIKLYDLVRGIDSRSIRMDRVRKSISVENTYGTDINKESLILEKIENLFHELVRRCEKNEIPESKIRGYVLKVKYHDFTSKTHEVSARQWPEVENYKNLFRTLPKGDFDSDEQRPIRLLGVGLKLFAEKSLEDSEQLPLF